MALQESIRRKGDLCGSSLIGAVESYWDDRSTAYSVWVNEEMHSEVMSAWRDVFIDRLGQQHASRLETGERPRALDLGCGPGMFSILLAQMGYDVTAVDLSAEMLSQARSNAQLAGMADCISFVQSNVANLPLASDQFVVVVLRNVTWLMEDPLASYREWHRVMKRGGKMLCFDANWYHYLVDEEDTPRHSQDQVDIALLGHSEGASWTVEQERQCELIARALPSTYTMRPQWDLCVLRYLGFSSATADMNVYQTLWTEEEKSFYSSTPMFLVEAVK